MRTDKKYKKMVKLELCIFIFVIFEKFLVVKGATHWVVTETGRIQAYVSNIFSDLYFEGYEKVNLISQNLPRF